MAPRKTRRARRGSEAPATRTPRGPKVHSLSKLEPGTLRRSNPGDQLRCVVLAPGPTEWAAVDLASGAIVRAPAGLLGIAASGQETLDVVDIVLGSYDAPPDPARPEGVVLEGPPRFVGRLRRRQARRLLRRISARGATRPLLGSLGPSISYVELEGDSPSIVVIPLDGGIRITAARDALWCSFASGGAKESLPLVPERAPAALSIAPGAIVEGSRVSALLGFEPRYLVVALLSPDAGHARKSVIGILPRP